MDHMTMKSTTEGGASIAAAQARVKAVPAGETLIEQISDAEWLDPDVADWRIELWKQKRTT